MIVKTKDGKEFSSEGEKERLIGSVPTGSYKMFIYNRKIASITE